MPIMAFELVDLGAFLGLGMATLFVALVVTGLTLWLRARERERGDDRGYYPGL